MIKIMIMIMNYRTNFWIIVSSGRS